MSLFVITTDFLFDVTTGFLFVITTSFIFVITTGLFFIMGFQIEGLRAKDSDSVFMKLAGEKEVRACLVENIVRTCLVEALYQTVRGDRGGGYGGGNEFHHYSMLNNIAANIRGGVRMGGCNKVRCFSTSTLLRVIILHDMIKFIFISASISKQCMCVNVWSFLPQLFTFFSLSLETYKLHEHFFNIYIYIHTHMKIIVGG